MSQYGAMRTVPTRVIEVVINLTSLDIFIREVVLKEHLKKHLTMTRLHTVDIQPEGIRDANYARER